MMKRHCQCCDGRGWMGLTTCPACEGSGFDPDGCSRCMAEGIAFNEEGEFLCAEHLSEWAADGQHSSWARMEVRPLVLAEGGT